MTRAWRWLPAVALVGIAVAVLIIGASRPSHPTLDQRVLSIAGEVRCPVCEGQSAAQSDTASSMQIRGEIRQQLQAGRSQQQIVAGIVQAYGPGILEKPPASGVSLTVWVIPVVAFVLALGGLGVAFARWRSGSAASPPTVEDRRLVDQALQPARPADPTHTGTGSPAPPDTGKAGDAGDPAESRSQTRG